MKYLPLLVKNLFRKKTRLILTVGSFAVAMFLFGFLAIVHNSFSLASNVAGADRLMVQNRVSIIQPLPFSYRDRMLQMSGVKEVTYANWFGGVYQDEKNFFPQYAIDVPTWRSMYPELAVPDDQWKAFVDDRQGCIVGIKTAQKYGFKVGDRVPIKGTIFQGTWEFNVRGIYNSSKQGEDLTQFWFHQDYLDEGRKFGKGTVGWYVIKVDNPDHAVKVSETVDSTFANSSFETKTQTEKAFIAGWAKQTGNIGLLVTIIGSIVFFTLLLVIGNTMAMTVRERVRELAVFKAIGFSNAFVLLLVLAESVLIAVIGGCLGLGGVKIVTILGDPTNGMIQAFYLPGNMAALGAAIALGVGLLAGMLPAVSASRLRVVDALRRI